MRVDTYVVLAILSWIAQAYREGGHHDGYVEGQQHGYSHEHKGVHGESDHEERGDRLVTRAYKSHIVTKTIVETPTVVVTKTKCRYHHHHHEHETITSTVTRTVVETPTVIVTETACRGYRETPRPLPCPEGDAEHEHKATAKAKPIPCPSEDVEGERKKSAKAKSGPCAGAPNHHEDGHAHQHGATKGKKGSSQHY